MLIEVRKKLKKEENKLKLGGEGEKEILKKWEMNIKGEVDWRIMRLRMKELKIRVRGVLKKI